MILPSLLPSRRCSLEIEKIAVVKLAEIECINVQN